MTLSASRARGQAGESYQQSVTLGVRLPLGAGVGSAIGFLQAPIAYEITRSAIISLDDFDAARVNKLLQQMIRDATAVVKPIGTGNPTST